MLLTLPLKQNHAANRLATLHQVKRIVDVFQRHFMGDQVVDVNAPFHIHVDDFQHDGNNTVTIWLPRKDASEMPEVIGDNQIAA